MGESQRFEQAFVSPKRDKTRPSRNWVLALGEWKFLCQELELRDEPREEC